MERNERDEKYWDEMSDHRTAPGIYKKVDFSE